MNPPKYKYKKHYHVLFKQSYDIANYLDEGYPKYKKLVCISSFNPNILNSAHSYHYSVLV